ncbi:NADH dehydrogenase subunit 1 (mitochondrion) [Panonychus citri]|uniref:NADH-ubiquinone oxidoreductase chain 1 n=1 Tax=Panonychus citri TaxID=50023 RepID=D9J2S7_PANCT|nr:NADH dehydrogenase subunit 1 [Panonychus citri]ADJ66665.1 NADH dehydrogenase subunit 1 [Panonychus citri]
MFFMQILIMLMSLITVMFITLMERKFLGILNNRKAPNYLLFMSVLQSLNDFLKLITKKIFKMNFIMKLYWMMMIFFGMMMFLLIMMIFPLNNSLMYYYLNFYMFFLIYSLMAFFFLVLSYSSNSIYSMMAMTRVLIQIISYEVGMIFLFLLPLFLLNEFNFFMYYMSKNLILLFSLMYLMTFMMIVLSEMNRTPFDFLESETELVSGFNVEYFSSLFSFIFLVEYGFFLFMMILITFFFNLNFMIMLSLTIMFIWTRAFMPRYRYDKMLNLFWKDLVIMVMILFL